MKLLRVKMPHLVIHFVINVSRRIDMESAPYAGVGTSVFRRLARLPRGGRDDGVHGMDAGAAVEEPGAVFVAVFQHVPLMPPD